MNASTGKILGIIFLVLVVFFAVGAIRFLFFAPAGVIHGVFNGWDGFHWDRIWNWGWPWVGFVGLFGLAVLAFWIAVVVWVYRDAEKRGMNAAIWALVVLFTHLVGLIIYAIVRGSHPIPMSAGGVPPVSGPAPFRPAPSSPAPSGPPPAGCPHCGKPAGRDQNFCAHCGARLRPACLKCGAEIRPEWKACPSCGEKL